MSILPPLPNIFHALPTLVKKSLTPVQSWMPKCSSTTSWSNSSFLPYSLKKSFLMMPSSCEKRDSSRTGLGVWKRGQPVVSSILKGESISRILGVILMRFSSQGLSLCFPKCLAKVVMKACLPVSDLPATNTLPCTFSLFRISIMLSRAADLVLWSVLNLISFSHLPETDAYVLVMAGSLRWSALVRREMILMFFSRHLPLNCSSMQASGLRTSSNSRTTDTFSSNLSRLVTYFLMRLSLGLGRQAGLFSRLMSPYSPWSSVSFSGATYSGWALRASSSICCLKGNMLGRQSERASPLCLRPFPFNFLASFLTRLLCCLTFFSILYLTLNVLRLEGRPFALFVNFTIRLVYYISTIAHTHYQPIVLQQPPRGKVYHGYNPSVEVVGGLRRVFVA